MKHFKGTRAELALLVRLGVTDNREEILEALKTWHARTARIKTRLPERTEPSSLTDFWLPSRNSRRYEQSEMAYGKMSSSWRRHLTLRPKV